MESEEKDMRINQARMVGTFERLVSIDSPSLGEREMCDYLRSRLEGLGLAAAEDDAGRQIGGSCGNLYGFLAGSEALEPLLFCAHMDTVEPSAGKRAVIGGDGVIRSGGDTVLGADDCSGITAILEALSLIREQGLAHRPVEVLFTAAEERYGQGAKQFDCSRLRSKEAYVLDLTGPVGTAAYKAPTILFFEAAVEGRASHAGFAPEEGVHAILAAADAVLKLPSGRIDPETTLNVGRIQGGLAANIVPELCRISGEIRSSSHERALALADTVRQQFERSAAAAGARAAFSTRLGVRAYETPAEHPVVRRYRQACQKLALPYSLVQTFAGSDNNILAEHGITGIVPACAMNKCHSCGEYTRVDELRRAAALTLTLMTE
jgi:tripeptide aminopeptidase